MPTALVSPPWTPTGREFYRFTVDQYHRLGDIGFRRPPGGVELLDGLIVLKWPPWGHSGWEKDQYRFSVEEYHRLIEAGFFVGGEKVELLEGLLVIKMGINPPHSSGVQNSRKRIEALLSAGWILRVQDAITLATTEPQPDVAVARGEDADYHTRHPNPTDLGLVVEVADSSLTTDQIDKARMYGAAGIVEYWIVNLIDRQVEVLTQPTATGYATTQTYLPVQSVPLTLDGVAVGAVTVADLLP